MSGNINRRKFLKASAAGMAVTVVPRHVLGGPGHTAPSDQLTMAYIGCGTQGLREMSDLLKNPKIRVVSVCDPNRFSTDYRDWSVTDIRNRMREATGDPSWGASITGIPGGRDVGREMVEKFYGRTLPSGKWKGCSAYEDFRELLEKENSIDAVKVMTPDHLHAAVSIAAMKKGKHVVIHKPIGNRMHEARLTIETARKTGANTHLLAWADIPGNRIVKQMIDEGAIGTLREIHNWSNRPVWPQWYRNPTETVPVPEGMNWQLWLGPVPDRPYHPDYTHMTFRGWYDFGGGTICDMGHYSLWPLFLSLGIDTPPVSAEGCGTTHREFVGQVSRGVTNDVAFPYSSTVRFRFPAQKTLGAFDLFWYDGGMKPPIPDELADGDAALPAEGMMLVGDKGKILAGFRCEDPKLIPSSKMSAWTNGRQWTDKEDEKRDKNVWVDAFLSGKPSPGNFQLASTVSETILLGTVAIRTAKRLLYDSKTMRITNNETANQHFFREYRKGWEL